MRKIEEKIIKRYGKIPMGYGRVIGVLKNADQHLLFTHGDKHPMSSRIEVRLLLDEYILQAISCFGEGFVYVIYCDFSGGVYVKAINIPEGFSFGKLIREEA